MSRLQAAPLILLYRALQRRHPRERALDIARAAAVAGGRAFLRRSLGALDRATLSQLDDDERRAFAEEKSARFFNAEVRWQHIGADDVSFEVTACHFPALCEAVGAPELAPLFCETDAAYFGSVEPNVVLERSETLATGGERCPFRLRWAEKPRQP